MYLLMLQNKSGCRPKLQWKDHSHQPSLSKHFVKKKKSSLLPIFSSVILSCFQEHHFKQGFYFQSSPNEFRFWVHFNGIHALSKTVWHNDAILSGASLPSQQLTFKPGSEHAFHSGRKISKNCAKILFSQTKARVINNHNTVAASESAA